MALEKFGYETTFSAHFLTINNLLSSISDFHFEFGDDPSYLKNSLEKIQSIKQSITSLQQLLSLEKDGLEKMNVWFGLSNLLDKTVEFIEDVKQKNVGSTKQTQKLRKFLQQIDRSLQETYATIAPIQ